MLKKIENLEFYDKPILINGWDKVKKLFPKQKITNKQISEKIFWTFSEKEKKNDHAKDVEKFKNFCIDFMGSKYSYYFLNPFELSYWNVKKLINRINQIKVNKFYYFDGKHFFLLIENYVFGINMDFLTYTKITENKVKKWLKSKNFEIIEISSIFNKEEINNKEYLIPILGKEHYEEQFVIGYIFE